MSDKQASEKSAPNREELFQMAVTAARSGQQRGARVMFQKVLQENPKSVRAMLWMAKLSRNPKERRAWLDRVLEIDRQNETALDALEQMDYREAARRNRAYLRIGVGAYVGTLALVCLVILVVLATLPPPT